MMTPLRQEAIQVLESVPEEKLDYVIQIMKDTNGFLETEKIKKEKINGLNQFVMPATERGQIANDYIRELRDNDRF